MDFTSAAHLFISDLICAAKASGVLVRGVPATLLLWGPDYDGTHKALVRYDDGRETVIGGSQVERG